MVFSIRSVDSDRWDADINVHPPAQLTHHCLSGYYHSSLVAYARHRSCLGLPDLVSDQDDKYYLDRDYSLSELIEKVSSL